MQINRVLTKFKDHNIAGLDRLEPYEFPQSFSGRIGKHTRVLTAPTSGKECVYYRTHCEEEVRKTRTVTKDGKQEREEYTDWETRFVEEESCDFFLIDAHNSNFKVFVPVQGINVKNQSTVDAFRQTYPRGSHYPHHLSVSF